MQTPDLPPKAPCPKSDPMRANSRQPTWKAVPGDGSSYINSVAVSADGGTVVGGTFFHAYGSVPSSRKSSTARGKAGGTEGAATGTFGVYGYNRDGSLRWNDVFSAWEGVYWVALSADGSRAAAGGNWSESPRQGFIRAYDAATGGVLLDHRTSQRVNQVALSADGTWLLAAAECVYLFQYDETNGAYGLKSTYAPDASTDNDVVSVGLSADGSSAVCSDYDGHVVLLANDGGTLSCTRQWTMPTGFCHMLSLASDGQAFAAGGAAGQFHLFAATKFIATGTPTYTYDTGVPDAVYGVSVSQDGQVFAGVVNDGADAGRAYVVTIAGGAPVLRAKVSTARNPNCIALNLDHGYAAIADGHPDGTPGNFYLYGGIVASPASQLVATLQWQYTTANMSWPITIAANGSAVVGGSDDGGIYYFGSGPA